MIQLAFAQLGKIAVDGYNLVWNNPTASPADIVAALGTDATALFELAALNASTVNSAATIGATPAPTIQSVPTGYSVTVNPDGTVTVTTPQ